MIKSKLRKKIKYYVFICLIFLYAPTNFAQNFNLNILPKQKIYDRYYADALSHQLSISKHLESRQWFGNIGANIPLADLTIYNHTIQISAAATVFNTLIKTPGHIQVYTVDYLVDFYFDKKITSNFTARFLWGHLSAHYSDDGITQLNNFPISYVRDYTGVHAEYLLNMINGKIYGGVFYNFHNEPILDKHTTYQFGFDGGINFLKSLFGYVAFDLKIKSEAANGTTQSFQIGIKYSSNSSRAIRLAFTNRRGLEERGQLFNLKDVKNTLGLFIDF